MKLRLNPFALAKHNNFAPRIFGREFAELPLWFWWLSHVALGWLATPFVAVGMLLARRYQPNDHAFLAIVGPFMALALGLRFAIWDKSVWVEWKRPWWTTAIHEREFEMGDPADFLSDTGLTVLGAFTPLLWSGRGALLSLVVFAILGTFNGQQPLSEQQAS